MRTANSSLEYNWDIPPYRDPQVQFAHSCRDNKSNISCEADVHKTNSRRTSMADNERRQPLEFKLHGEKIKQPVDDFFMDSLACSVGSSALKPCDVQHLKVPSVTNSNFNPVQPRSNIRDQTSESVTRQLQTSLNARDCENLITEFCEASAVLTSSTSGLRRSISCPARINTVLSDTLDFAVCSDDESGDSESEDENEFDGWKLIDQAELITSPENNQTHEETIHLSNFSHINQPLPIEISRNIYNNASGDDIGSQIEQESQGMVVMILHQFAVFEFYASSHREFKFASNMH